MTDDVIKGYVVKLENRRVWLGQSAEGKFHIGFRRLGDKADGGPKDVELAFSLSPEAMRALVSIYTESFMKM